MRSSSVTLPIFSWGSSIFFLSDFTVGTGCSSSGGITPSISSIILWISGGRIGSAAFFSTDLLSSVSFSAALLSLSSFSSATAISLSAASAAASGSVASSMIASSFGSTSSIISSSFSGSPSHPVRISSRLICPVI